MSPATASFSATRVGNILVVKHEAALEGGSIEEAAAELIELMEHGGAKDIVLDLHAMADAPWQASRLSVELWKRVRDHGGNMAICISA
jgi:hypothetical protein